MKRIIAIIVLIYSFVSLSAQDISEVVTTMPGDIVLGLDAGMKDILLSRPGDTLQVEVEREVPGSVKRLAMTSDFIHLKTSDAGTTQIKLLPLINDSKIICVVKTVCGGVCDSRIAFYTTKWTPIAEGNLFRPVTRDEFVRADADRNSQGFKNAYAALDMDPIKMKLSPDKLSLTIEYDIEGYLPEEDYKEIKPFLKEEPIVLNWDKISFK
ncbi:DUF3256 family protein [Dysgonomonas sp. 511]|uniref:DUF3256 family protein n=1 Tax=Dysgonomonas sp. 511 TaxID=2302930 RepID=UPI0013D71E04|nr:DUF3256 family protein [Dysgonomonas sp. 511]NDV77928.1 DUF3256 family protein [Dysgonomonas sp. 511]